MKTAHQRKMQIFFKIYKTQALCFHPGRRFGNATFQNFVCLHTSESFASGFFECALPFCILFIFNSLVQYVLMEMNTNVFISYRVAKRRMNTNVYICVHTSPFQAKNRERCCAPPDFRYFKDGFDLSVIKFVAQYFVYSCRSSSVMAEYPLQ